jgi:hypothetical protein
MTGRSAERENLDNLLDRLLKVPHSEMKAKHPIPPNSKSG